MIVFSPLFTFYGLLYLNMYVILQLFLDQVLCYVGLNTPVTLLLFHLRLLQHMRHQILIRLKYLFLLLYTNY